MKLSVSVVEHVVSHKEERTPAEPLVPVLKFTSEREQNDHPGLKSAHSVRHLSFTLKTSSTKPS